MSYWLPWILWLLGSITSFALLESYAIRTGKLWTLSHFMAVLGIDWPMTIFLAGLVCGGLAVHFWWHFAG